MNRRTDTEAFLPLQRAIRSELDALASDLRAELKGPVLFDGGSRALYATDSSNYRQVPLGVVLPRDAEDVEAVLAVCRRYGAPVLSRGAGTSLAGQCCNVAVVLDFSRYMNRTLEIDPERRLARVQPGVILERLRREAARHGLTFAPDPGTHTSNTLGGMIGNNSCGVHAVMGGRTSDNVIALDVFTYDGTRLVLSETQEQDLSRYLQTGGRVSEIFTRLLHLRERYGSLIRARFPAIPRHVSGYNLPDLLPDKGFHVARALVGSKGSCVTVVEATVQLVEAPPARALLVLGYADVFSAADHVPEIMAFGPVGLEGVDDRWGADPQAGGSTGLLPPGGGWLLAEFGGAVAEEAEANARRAMNYLEGVSSPPAMRLYTTARIQAQVWELREAGRGATAHLPGRALIWPVWEDSAVPPERLGEYLRRLRALLTRHGYGCDLYGHFGQGCVHTRIDFDRESADGVARCRRFLQEAADLVVTLGGACSAEHGDGQGRAELLERMYGVELVQAFREFKSIWDPLGRMNPGKVVDPFHAGENLRAGPSFTPVTVTTAFHYPADRGDFTRAVQRCVGVGKCRREEGGVMCPSYMVTREERHSTRGRARLLFEMLHGSVITDGWQSETVKEALELCLSCKGCRGECPVNVDMATYKAEFLHHYYQRHRRLREALFFANVDRIARLAARAPRLANVLTQRRPFTSWAKWAAGVAPERRLPVFPQQTFKHWFARRRQRGEGPPVILWADTFNNHFLPDTAKAAVAVLEAAGFSVQVPMQPLCCGRPLYAYGLLDRARESLRGILGTLAVPIREGVPVVMLEPACASVFQVELPELFSRDRQAAQLARQTFLLADFLHRNAPHWRPPHLARKALLHLHCHHRALMPVDSDRVLLDAMGLDTRFPDSGCCGMAGAFGMVRAKYDVSIAAGERVLLPAVRNSDADTLIIADGYSCREQILQCMGRAALHPAEVIALALRSHR
ncbi:MAG: FAD-linked oxidase C-terminal domain-containing protein [Thiohalomonadaceae bacterium]